MSEHQAKKPKVPLTDEQIINRFIVFAAIIGFWVAIVIIAIGREG